MAGLNGLHLFGNLLKLQHLNTFKFVWDFIISNSCQIWNKVCICSSNQISCELEIFGYSKKREIGFRVIMLNKFTWHNNTGGPVLPKRQVCLNANKEDNLLIAHKENHATQQLCSIRRWGWIWPGQMSMQQNQRKLIWSVHISLVF